MIRRILQLGGRFEAASIYEIDKCMKAGASVSDIHFGNTIKKIDHITHSYQLGIDNYSFDSVMELEKLAKFSPGAKVSCRLQMDGKGAVWGLGEKFGRSKPEVIHLLCYAADLGLKPSAISFHVGSQQKDPQAWFRALQEVSEIYEIMRKQGIELNILNLGGGFPVSGYQDQQGHSIEFNIEEYGQVITTALEKFFGKPAQDDLHLILEPGRYMVGGAGVIKSEVIYASERMIDGSRQPWVYLDVGKFNGLWEAGDIRYPIEVIKRSNSHSLKHESIRATVLAGPTCDNEDILYRAKDNILLSSHLASGDSVLFFNAGAYTASYTMHGFNGLPPIAEYYI